MQSEELAIETIVGRVVDELADRGARSAAAEAPPAFDGRGILEDVGGCVAAAQRSFEELSGLPLQSRRAFVEAMRRAALDNVSRLSELAVEETGLGRVEDKIRKNKLVAERTPGIEELHPSAYSGDHGLTLVERAPYGVIGSITPSTNPSETIICNAIGMVAGGNSVVFNPHPGARVVSLTAIDILNRAIAEAGGPRALLYSVERPTIETAQELMSHDGVRLLVVTGGPGVVRAAMLSGKKVIAAGPGNPPVVVDETADVPAAARDIIAGATLDNNIVCIAEKVIIAVRAVAGDLKEALVQAGALELRGQSKELVSRTVIEEDLGPRRSSKLNRGLIGKDVSVILESAGVPCPAGTRLAFMESDRGHPLVWTEQMMPVLPLVVVEHAEEAMTFAFEVEGGRGHTAVAHSRNIELLSRMARSMNVSIFVKNGPSYAGLGFGGEGYTSFTIASPTGEGLTRASTFTRERRCTLVDYFRII
ncbi:MAG: aldehyde dehydrogenase family protein [Candidatus Eisenbacteria bacterium]|nr:aldehyde dehydrogenase family protein [Candidatus Eisenbacteria bacterium]